MARGVEALLCTNLAQTFAATALVVMAATNVRPIRTNVPTGKQVFFHQQLAPPSLQYSMLALPLRSSRGRLMTSAPGPGAANPSASEEEGVDDEHLLGPSFHQTGRVH
jgi:hypothetical protein